MDAAMKLFVHYGFDGVSHTMIANEAGVVRSAIPKFFGNTENLAVLCMRQFINFFVDQVEASTELGGSYQDQVERSAALFKNYRDEWRFLLSVMVTPAHKEMTEALWSDGFDERLKILLPFADKSSTEQFPDIVYQILALHFSYVIGGNEKQYDRSRAALMRAFFPDK